MHKHRNSCMFCGLYCCRCEKIKGNKNAKSVPDFFCFALFFGWTSETLVRIYNETTGDERYDGQRAVHKGLDPCGRHQDRFQLRAGRLGQETPEETHQDQASPARGALRLRESVSQSVSQLVNQSYIRSVV